MDLDKALGLIAEVPDFPEPGVLFRDFAPLFAHAEGFRAVVDALADTLDPGTDLVAGIEARGFVLAAAVGYARGLGVAMVRKPGKLPKVSGRVDYALEYGTASLELPADVIPAGAQVVVLDDVLATGGTGAAAVKLIQDAGAVVARLSVVMELAALGGRTPLAGIPVTALTQV